MVYGSIKEVRALIGRRQVREHGYSLKDGDGSTTEFKIPAIGNNKAFLVDKDATTTSTITTDDITVFVDGSPVTVSSIDEEKGSVVLDVAPSNGAKVTIDFSHSPISDAEVIKGMQIAEEIVDEIIQGKNVAGNTHEQEILGDGKTTVFKFEHKDVVSVSSVVVNDITKTEGTDYELLKLPRRSVYHKIRFFIPPSYEYQEPNIVINYTYGLVKYNFTLLSNLLAGRYLLNYVVPDQSSGQFVKGQTKQKRSKNYNKLKSINYQIAEILDYFDRREGVKIA